MSVAASRGFSNVVKLLLANGAKVNAEVSSELGLACQPA